jgi:hypothetical protein
MIIFYFNSYLNGQENQTAVAFATRQCLPRHTAPRKTKSHVRGLKSLRRPKGGIQEEGGELQEARGRAEGEGYFDSRSLDKILDLPTVA